MTLTLVCFAHAGGNGALFRSWAARLPSWVTVRAVTLPGRGAMRAFTPLETWPAVLDHLDHTLADVAESDAPVAVFGHSMGALIGFEWLQRLRQRRGRQAVWFGASGTVWPALREEEDGWLVASASEMVSRLRTRGGTPPALLDDPAFIDMLMPVLRADFHLCGVHPAWFRARWHASCGMHESSTTDGEYDATPHDAARLAPLDCPLTVFVGRDDPATGNDEAVRSWSCGTTGRFGIRRFDGGHFFVESAAEDVMVAIALELEGCAAHPC